MVRDMFKNNNNFRLNTQRHFYHTDLSRILTTQCNWCFKFKKRVTKKFTRLSILTQRSFLDLWNCHCVTNLMTIKPENKCSHFAAFSTTVWWREKWAQRLNGHIVRFKGIIVELSYRLFFLLIYNHGIFGISWNVENIFPFSIFFLLFFYSLK